MTPQEAEDLAGRILDVIPVGRVVTADRERVMSDLAVIREDHTSFHRHGTTCIPCGRAAANLRRTAELYGVQHAAKIPGAP